MKQAMEKMAKLALKLAFGQTFGLAETEGYLPQGYRQNVLSDKIGAQRAVETLLKRLKGEAFTTEVPLPKYEYVPSAAPVPDLTKATLALVTEGGCVPRGNPDKIRSAWATNWGKYFIGDLTRLTSGDHLSVHGGFDTTYVNQDPNRLVPLDVIRDIEKEAIIGKLYDYFYATVGNVGSISTVTMLGNEIAEDLKSNKIDAVILTAT
jgi:glycine reductase